MIPYKITVGVLLLTLALVRFLRRRQVAPLVGGVSAARSMARTDEEARA